MSFNAYYNLRHSLEAAEGSEYRKLELLATSTASRLDQLIIDTQRVVIQVSSERNVVSFLAATKPEAKEAFRPAAQSVLKNVFGSNPDYDAVYLMDRKGRCLASTDPSFVGQTYSFREYFQQAIEGHSYISSILMGKTTGRAGLYLSNPVRSDSGEIVGVAVVKIKEKDIGKIVNALSRDSKSYAFLVDQQGVIISHLDKSLMYHSLAPLSPETQKRIAADKRYGFTQVESLDLPQLAAVMVGASEPSHSSYYSQLKGKRQIVGLAPLEVVPWVLGVNKSEALFSAPLNRLIWQNSRSLIVVGAIAALIALLLARSIANPIHSLTKAAQALKQGDFDHEAGGNCDFSQDLSKASYTQDDIGQLVRVFLQMAQEVKVREQKLKQQVIALHIEVDEAKKAHQVAEITGTDYFQQLQQKAQQLREQALGHLKGEGGMGRGGERKQEWGNK
ncbi:MAG: HAMP domain-containing protein [Symploca sp. SIO2E9]|nr:HAMP domain-containing protein [Symploca sp. SIO2E9]